MTINFLFLLQGLIGYEFLISSNTWILGKVKQILGSDWIHKYVIILSIMCIMLFVFRPNMAGELSKEAKQKEELARNVNNLVRRCKTEEPLVYRYGIKSYWWHVSRNSGPESDLWGKPDPDSHHEKIRIRILPNVYLIKLTFHFFLWSNVSV